MACFGLPSRSEAFELRELLERTAAKNEDFRRRLDSIQRENDDLHLTLERERGENQELIQEAAYLRSEVPRLQHDAASAQQEAADAAVRCKEAEEAHRHTQECCDHFQAENKSMKVMVDRLGRDNEHLKARNRRMEKALAMLESVLDDTITETSRGGNPDSSQTGQAKAQALRQSRETINELKMEWELQRSQRPTRHASSQLDTVRSDSNQSPVSSSRTKDQRNGLGGDEVQSVLGPTPMVAARPRY